MNLPRLLVAVCLNVSPCFVIATPVSEYHLMIAPGTSTENSVTILWDKQYGVEGLVYDVILNGRLTASTTRTNYTIKALSPNTTYKVTVRAKQSGNDQTETNSIKFTTTSKGKVYNIVDYGARSDSAFKSTKAIQAAIDACTPAELFIYHREHLHPELFF